jgi:hypothetical protein
MHHRVVHDHFFEIRILFFVWQVAINQEIANFQEVTFAR